LSNAGSLLALVSFPVFFEPQFTRQTQIRFWEWGFIVYSMVCVACAIHYWGTLHKESVVPVLKDEKKPEAIQSEEAPIKTSVMQRLLWLLYPACDSVLLLATTNKMCQEVAVIPFLWVLPLSCYLLSFIICFDNARWYVRPLFIPLLAVSWAIWLLVLQLRTPINQQLAVYAIGLFIACMVCHGEVYRLRPHPRQLTLFYLFIAAGGVLGALFVAVAAPLLFRGYFELESGIFFSGILLTVTFILNWQQLATRRWRWPAMAGVSIGLPLLGAIVWNKTHYSDRSGLQKTRNFYGVLTLSTVQSSETQESFRMLEHGSTLHGTQFTESQRSIIPTLYYGTKSGVGLAIQALPAGNRNVGMVGCGVGTVAAYGNAGDHFYIYEINPEVLRIANSAFRFLSNSPATLEITLGDARLALERSPARHFDLLVLDAFNSDAIPVHLLTREAFQIYNRHLKSNGVVAVHITNRLLDLEPVIANVARELNFRMAIIDEAAPRDEWWNADNLWVLLSRSRDVIDSHAIRVAARPPRHRPGSVRLWTDNFASVFQVLRSRPIVRHPDFEEEQFEVARGYGEGGNYAKSISTFQDALKVEPESAAFHNNLAFLLATSTDARARDIAQAVVHAERACELTSYKHAGMVGTLAAVYSEAGRFEDATLMAEKACNLATDSGQRELSSFNRELLEAYRANRPYHETAKH
jgi:spermidine synthase